MKEMKEEIALKLLDIKAVSLSPGKPFRYASGILSPIYCDNRMTMSYPDVRTAIRNAFIRLIEEEKITYDVIGGIATAGIPHAMLVAQKLEAPMIYIRSEPKGHGKENLVEGKLENGQKVLVIEDLISTGGSSLKAIEGVRQQGGVVEYCLAISTYQMKKAEDAFKAAGVKLITITDFTSIIEAAARTGYIKPEEKEMVMDWKSDPQGWGQRQGLER